MDTAKACLARVHRRPLREGRFQPPESYVMRWRISESTEFVKQIFYIGVIDPESKSDLIVELCHLCFVWSVISGKNSKRYEMDCEYAT